LLKSNEKLKKEVQSYWNNQPCGTQFTNKPKYSKEYFDEIEHRRYMLYPEVKSFAEFEKFQNKKILEVGVGIGTDFIQFLHAGANAYGIDLTPEGIEHVKRMLQIYNLKAEEVKVADCENIPYDDNTFDLVYSLGVIHHSPNTKKALNEIVRTCRPGGICKIMLYNRYSLVALFLWMKYAFLKAKPFKPISWVLFYHMESIGTKGFTKKEIREMLNDLPVENISIKTILNTQHTFEKFNTSIHNISKFFSNLPNGNNLGLFLYIEFNKKLV